MRLNGECTRGHDWNQYGDENDINTQQKDTMQHTNDVLNTIRLPSTIMM